MERARLTALELYLFEDRHNRVCVRVSGSERVRAPFPLETAEALTILKVLSGALDRHLQEQETP